MRDRCITRDLVWGVPVPKPGFEGKVFYVWFDAPIGYIAAAVEWAAATGRDWRDWWHGGDAVRYVQFLAKDNVPFHTVSFPATILGSGLPLKLADQIKGFNWLTYDGGKFSTSRGRGIFTDQALDLLAADYWRWWLAANAPEGNDVDFTVARFAAGVSADLADNFGNLVNRCLRFAVARFGDALPAGGVPGDAEQALAVALGQQLRALRQHHEALNFRKTADAVRAVWRLGNGYLSSAAPWQIGERDRAAVVVRTGVNLVRIAAIAAWPFIPSSAERVLACLGEPTRLPPWTEDGAAALAALPSGRSIRAPDLLFLKLDAAAVAQLTARFAPATAAG